eukprot:CAMPEP_0206218928 /NCGR_PEP_ID=MMETSP0047_2-20121206/4053_1 /ASSEMBLY_ACC=CAM_ASM_000192 /TAXON_ID=195065 /ORGANISM="Chroomonas mesostigmatica_cf, Strain CCMP1168" /LENGTH=85 /DNA_ID=CAMNT_0053641449 /DNA_START=140 /DNA_END=397 /DNA_ORIENTATION=-
MGRAANDHGKRAPDTGSKKKFDTNRQINQNTGQYNYKAGKKERAALKAGKNEILPDTSLAFACSITVVVAMVIAFIVWYVATSED